MPPLPSGTGKYAALGTHHAAQGLHYLPKGLQYCQRAVGPYPSGRGGILYQSNLHPKGTKLN